MVCRHCGETCEDGASACPHCGRPPTVLYGREAAIKNKNLGCGLRPQPALGGEDGWFSSEETGPAWPNDEEGRPARAVRLVYAQNPMDIGLKRSLLRAFGIPTRVRTPNPTFFSNVIFGAPIYGAELFVPESLLEAARDILEAPAAETEEEMP